MSQLHDNPTLERRKQVRLRLRPGLVISLQENGTRQCFVVKDPVTLRYFYLEANQRFIVQLMDGNHSLAEIQKAYEEQFRPERLSLDEVEAFASQLLESGLVHNESAQAGKMLYQRALRQQKQTLWLTLLNFLCYRLPVWGPDRFLNAIGGVGRVFFHPWTVLASLVIFLTALVLVVARRNILVADLPSLQDFLKRKKPDPPLVPPGPGQGSSRTRPRPVLPNAGRSRSKHGHHVFGLLSDPLLQCVR